MGKSVGVCVWWDYFSLLYEELDMIKYWKLEKRFKEKLKWLK